MAGEALSSFAHALGCLIQRRITAAESSGDTEAARDLLTAQFHLAKAREKFAEIENRKKETRSA